MHWRTRDLLVRRGPPALLVASIGFVILLAVAGPASTVPGYAEVAPVRVASLEAGRVVDVDIAPGQIVEQGAVVGTLDDGPIRGRMRILTAELSRSGALLEGQERSAQTALTVAEADRAETAARLAAARGGLALARQRLADRKKQVDVGLETRDSLTPLRTEVATLEGEVGRLSARIGAQSKVAKAAASGLDTAGGGTAPALASQAGALGVVQEELALLEERRKELTLAAPLAARVAAVNFRVGEIVPEQGVFAELLPLSTTRVVACLPEQFVGRVEAGGSVSLWPADGGAVRGGTIVDVSGLVSEAPDRCKQRPNEMGWVRPVRIEVQGEGLVPGQRFDVAFGQET
jgi:multidrug resistance efflux pump